MPNFPFPAAPTDFTPQWPPEPQIPNKDLNPPTALQRLTDQSGQGRADLIRRSEQGPFKPAAQLFNALASPDTKMGVFTGPINGISKLGNAIGDIVQGKPQDTSDAWLITDKQARQLNPWRNLTGMGQTVLPADEAGLEIGEGIGAEVAGAMTGATLLRGVGRLAQLKAAADALRRTQTVRNLAVASQASPALRAGLNVSKNVGEALVSTTLATPFLNQEDGNLANLGDAVGLNLPGRVEEGQNYLQAMGQSILVEGIAAPLALLGAGSLIKPIREGLAKGDLGWVDQLADAELEPYRAAVSANANLGATSPGLVVEMPSAGDPPTRPRGGPLAVVRNRVDDKIGDFAKAPPGEWSQGWDPARNPWDAGGAMVPYDSAIGRSLQEQTQIRQVAEQRQRLRDMGLIRQGEGGQLELDLGGAVDPEIRLQIRQLQAQRGQLIKQAGETGEDLTQQLGEIDQQIGDLIQAGRASDFMPDEGYIQPEFDMPDPRPEIDTYLANLDELSDQQLRQIHQSVYQEQIAARNAEELQATQGKVEELNQRLAEIQARADAGEITATGAKRLASKVQKEMAALEEQLAAIESRQRTPESLVGDQLQLVLPPEQLELGMAPAMADELGPMRALQMQRERIGGMADEVDAQLKALRAEKADAEQIKGAAAQQKALRSTLAQLDGEIAAARKGLSPEAQLQLTSERWRSREEAASEFGYETPEDYRNALQGWKRDELRRLAMPESSPEVAALVQARTGRRVWQAKKGDIIDALVEMSERRGRYLPPAPRAVDQPGFDLTTNEFGGGAPLFDRPADLDVPDMGQVVDADGNAVSVPMARYQARGLDAQTREQLKADILRRAIDNGEVQPPVTPLPERPRTTFQQSTFIDTLLADPTGQLPLDYVMGDLPTYKAGGKGADDLIEELRLRYEYHELDSEAQRAQRDAYLAEMGWDTMPWEEKKKLGILSEGFYSLQPYSDRFQKPTPQFTDELTPVAPRKPKQYRLTFDENGEAVIDAQPAQQAKPGKANAKGGGKGKPKDSATDAAPTAAAEETAKADQAVSSKAQREARAQNSKKRNAVLKKREAKQKERDELIRQSQGANC